MSEQPIEDNVNPDQKQNAPSGSTGDGATGDSDSTTIDDDAAGD